MRHIINRSHFLLFSLCIITSFTAYSQVLNTTVKSIDGGVTTIADETEADIIILDFWATWCKPCVKSIPKLAELSEKYKQSGVAFVGVNEDSPRNLVKVKPVSKNLGINYRVVLDTDQTIMSNLFVSAFPTLVIINREEEVLFTHEGFVAGDEVIIEEEILKLLKGNEK